MRIQHDGTYKNQLKSVPRRIEGVIKNKGDTRKNLFTYIFLNLKLPENLKLP